MLICIAIIRLDMIAQRWSGQITEFHLIFFKRIRIGVVIVDKLLMNLDLVFDFILDGLGHAKRNNNNEYG